MNTEHHKANAACIASEIEWFQGVLAARFAIHSSEQPACDILELNPPSALPASATAYAATCIECGLSPAERLVLMLAFLPHLRPDVLDPFFTQNQSLHRGFTEFGGMLGGSHGGFLPTAETAVFLLAGEDIALRLKVRSLFRPDAPLLRNRLVQLTRPHLHEPELAAALLLPPEAMERLTTGSRGDRPFNIHFPAHRIQTTYEWPDLVLEAQTRRDVEDIIAWAKHQEQLLGTWGLDKRLKPGYRCLFYGPPGTGKTLTASLLGKATGMPVYRVDLSRVVSKYIGETEKNLAGLFDEAEDRGWILFFDEADSLFGKRTESRTSNDRSANQQISYLLQRIEDFNGIAILATNQRTFLDEAFSRRFQSTIVFAMPDAEQRLRLLEDNFKDKPYPLAADVDLRRLARDYELSGGSLLNVLRYACLRAIERTPQEVSRQDIETAMRREGHKSGKFVTRS